MRHTQQGSVVEPVELKRLLRGGRALEAGALRDPLPVLASGDVLVVP